MFVDALSFGYLETMVLQTTRCVKFCRGLYRSFDRIGILWITNGFNFFNEENHSSQK